MRKLQENTLDENLFVRIFEVNKYKTATGIPQKLAHPMNKTMVLETIPQIRPWSKTHSFILEPFHSDNLTKLPSYN